LIVIGVTGKYCAGKDTVTQLLVAEGYHEINVDRLGHVVLDEQRNAIRNEFGDQVIGLDGTIDRRQLAELVFARRDRLRQLEAIVHPAMAHMVLDRISELKSKHPRSPGIVVNAAVLFRMALDHYCDAVLYVRAPLLARIRRAAARDGSSLPTTIQRLRSQGDVDPQFSTSNADICNVQNDGSVDGLRGQILRFLRRS
jgi:dephospho-CoA kinase